jgi:hypothetical protein
VQSTIRPKKLMQQQPGAVPKHFIMQVGTLFLLRGNAKRRKEERKHISLPSKTPNAVVEPGRFQLAKHMNFTFLASQRGVLYIPHFIGQDWIGRSVIWVPSVRVCLESGRESLKFVFDLGFPKMACLWLWQR